MRRRKSTILDDLAVMPWWCSPLAAAAAYFVIALVVPALLPTDRPTFSGIADALSTLAPIAAAVLLLPMPFALVRSFKIGRRVATTTKVADMQALSWKEFEELVAEVYRRWGYHVRENSRGGPDGGVDVVCVKDGRLHLVQCKHWRAQKVGVNVVRELFGVMTAERATSATVLTSGIFTQEAKNFAHGKPIDLIEGAQLQCMLEIAQKKEAVRSPAGTRSEKTDGDLCPQCGSKLVERIARRGRSAGQAFVGCSRFPACRFTRSF